VYISKEIKWLKEYLEIAKEYIPDKKFKQLKKVHSMHPPYNRKSRVYGHLQKDLETNHYSLLIKLSHFPIVRKDGEFKQKEKREYYDKIEILETLAHELAHLVFWDHTPAHKVLNAILTIKFMTKLSEDGYISTEEEMRELRRTQNGTERKKSSKSV